jgi:hypothetical protein
MRKLQRPFNVIRAVRLVGVDEEEIEGLNALGMELLEALKRRSIQNFDPIGEACALKVAARHRRMARIELQRDQAPVGGQRASEPQAAVAPERADLQDPPRPNHPSQDLQQLALGRADRDWG